MDFKLKSLKYKYPPELDPVKVPLFFQPGKGRWVFFKGEEGDVFCFLFLRENAGDLFILVFKGEVGEFFLRDSEASLGLQF